MTQSLADSAKAYTPKQTLNIADLNEVDIQLALFDGEGVGEDDKPFQYKFIEVAGVQYRVPGSVLGEIKQILAVAPNTKKIKVVKSGAGMSTRYKVIQL